MKSYNTFNYSFRKKVSMILTDEYDMIGDGRETDYNIC